MARLRRLGPTAPPLVEDKWKLAKLLDMSTIPFSEDLPGMTAEAAKRALGPPRLLVMASAPKKLLVAFIKTW